MPKLVYGQDSKNSDINLSDTGMYLPPPPPPRLRGGILACADGENDILNYLRGAHLDKEGQGVGLRIFALPDIEYQLSGTLR